MLVDQCEHSFGCANVKAKAVHMDATIVTKNTYNHKADGRLSLYSPTIRPAFFEPRTFVGNIVATTATNNWAFAR